MLEKTTPKIALVTGGSNGIGRAIVKKLADTGAKVIVADLQDTEEDAVAIFRKCDISSREDIAALFTWVHDNVGQPDIMVLNAGQGIKEKLTEGDPEKWAKIIDINLMGALRCIRAFVPEMVEKKQGHVVFISSVSASQPHPYGGIYSASKTALEVVAETLRQETLPWVKVTVVSPGIVATDFFQNQVSGPTTLEEIGMGSISPEEIAEDVWYALSKKNGTCINKITTRPVLQTF